MATTPSKDTYVWLADGDLNYYSTSGFPKIPREFAQAPLALSSLEGWLGQSLVSADHAPLVGPSHCVPALNNADLW